ncbi:DMT family transporter [Streptomyces acidicola]|uniref:DMT family transporter n=1 Tax=Streptomyces acidicola TaxID=2596892 RepID=A0A5N8WMG9_9ACTN|nr:DMT family transporter [Streptomyces acidicola]MPY48640.1 DMT family transporter [Streptomyces acidicola]
MSRNISTQFGALALLWGASFLFIKVSLEGLSPAQVMLGRIALGALFLAGVMTVTRRRWPRDARTWGALAVISVFLCVVPFSLYAWAGESIPSGLSSIYNATTPIAALLVSLAVLPDERLTRARVCGLILAFLGVSVVAAPWSTLGQAGADPFLLAQLACLGANLCYGIGFVLSRRLLRGTRHDTITTAAAQMVLATAIGLLLAPFIGGLEPVHVTPSVLSSMLVLGMAGTGLAYILNNRVIAAWGATNASTVTYLTPIVGVVLGILALGETIHWHEPAGAVLVLLGILISQGRLAPKRRGRATIPDTAPAHPTVHRTRADVRPAAGSSSE